MATDVEEWIRDCVRCEVSKGRVSKQHLVNIVTTQPLELVCLDYLTLDMSKGGFKNVLVITDHFTPYAIAIPTPNQTARTTAVKPLRRTLQSTAVFQDAYTQTRVAVLKIN